MSKTESPRFTDFPSLYAYSEPRLPNLIGSGLNLLCLQSHSKPECRCTRPGSRFLVLTKRSRASELRLADWDQLIRNKNVTQVLVVGFEPFSLNYKRWISYSKLLFFVSIKNYLISNYWNVPALPKILTLGFLYCNRR